MPRTAAPPAEPAAPAITSVACTFGKSASIGMGTVSTKANIARDVLTPEVLDQVFYQARLDVKIEYDIHTDEDGQALIGDEDGDITTVVHEGTVDVHGYSATAGGDWSFTLAFERTDETIDHLAGFLGKIGKITAKRTGDAGAEE